MRLIAALTFATIVAATGAAAQNRPQPPESEPAPPGTVESLDQPRHHDNRPQPNPEEHGAGTTGVTRPDDGTGVTRPGDRTGVTRPDDGTGITRPGDGTGVTRPGDGTGVTRSGGDTGVTRPGGVVLSLVGVLFVALLGLAAGRWLRARRRLAVRITLGSDTGRGQIAQRDLSTTAPPARIGMRLGTRPAVTTVRPLARSN
jgi:hypothetical protein